MSIPRCILTLILCALVGPLTGRAQTVLLTQTTNGLYDTGLASNGHLLSGSAQDPHYNLFSQPGGGTNTTHVVNTSSIPSTWVPDTTTAQWISNGANIPLSVNGTYDIQQVLSNIPVNKSVTISGSIAADDQVQIFANGLLALNLTTSTTYEGGFTTFTITFNSAANGINTLDYDVLQNVNNDVLGLIVDNLSGFYAPVPEPREWSMIVLLGIAGLMAVRKFKSGFIGSPRLVRVA